MLQKENKPPERAHAHIKEKNMKKKILRSVLAFALSLVCLLSLVACAAKPADELPEEPENSGTQEQPDTAPSTPETPDETPENAPEEDTSRELPVEEPEEEPEEQTVTDEELLRLVELQDTELPAHTMFLTNRANEENGDVSFEVAFRSASGWLVYAVKKYTASFNDDGGRLIAAEALFESDGEKPHLSEKASDPEELLRLIEGMEIGMLGEHAFCFMNPGDFTSQEMYTAYLLLAGEEELQKRYNEAEEKYFITWFNIKQVLDRYFIGYAFDIAECEQYDETFDGIVTGTVSGFGGARFIQITDITLNDEDCTVTFTGNFYTDETYQTLAALKTYRIQFYDNFESGEDTDGYYYLFAAELMVD